LSTRASGWKIEAVKNCAAKLERRSSPLCN